MSDHDWTAFFQLHMGLQVSFEKVGGFDPVAFDEGCVAALRSAARGRGIRGAVPGRRVMTAPPRRARPGPAV